MSKTLKGTTRLPKTLSGLSTDNLEVSTLDATNFISSLFIDTNDINVVERANMGTVDVVNYFQLPLVDTSKTPLEDIEVSAPGTMIFDTINKVIQVCTDIDDNGDTTWQTLGFIH